VPWTIASRTSATRTRLDPGARLSSPRRAASRYFKAAAIVASLFLLARPARCAPAIPLPADGEPASLEFEVKAAFLLNFARFVDWPSASAATPGSFVVGVLGADAFAETVERAVAGKTVGGHEVVVRRVRSVSGAQACRILFVGSAAPAASSRVLAELEEKHVLTVTDADRPGGGGVIRFFVEDRRVRFEVDLDAADRAGLKISSRLLSVARVVRESKAAGAAGVHSHALAAK
jgi:hypothetical protein